MGEMESAILYFTKLADIVLEQYGDDFYAKACKMADVCDKLIMNATLIEKPDFSIYHNLCKYLRTNRYAKLSYSALMTQLVIAIEKGWERPTLSSKHTKLFEPFQRRIWKEASENFVKVESLSFSTQNSGRTQSYGSLETPQIMTASTTSSMLTRTNIQSLFSTQLLLSSNASKIRK